MEIKIVLIRFLIVWLALNAILLPIEWYRYKNSHWSYGILEFTVFVIGIDLVIVTLAVVVPILYWVLNPIIN